MASEQQHNAQAMFNLGYMHEQGLGMKKDIHLAKRCYDLAAETSTDAKVPVALALMKLQLLFKLESLRESPFSVLLELDENIASNWDLYLITILTVVLGAALYFRRPPPPGAANYNQPAAAAPVEVAAEAVAAAEDAPLLDRPAAPSNTNQRQQQQREDAPQ